MDEPVGGERMTGRCELRYQDPATLQWRDCPHKGARSELVDGLWRALCASHRDEYARVQRAGFADQLQWVDLPEPRRRRTTVTPGQLSLEGVTP
jgi:hypothetical protein